MTVAGAGTVDPGSPPRRATRRLAGRAALVPLVLLASGCASLFGSHSTGPQGIASYDYELRTLLSQGSYDSALARIAPERSKAGDDLLRLQNEVLVAHHAGRPEESADALERALTLADDRYTRSVSRAILSALTNDRVLPYRPPPTERLLLHYYGALVHLRLGGAAAAAVEARRLEQRLQMAEDEAEPTGARRGLHVTFHRLAGTIFEAAGERNAAAVAYRRADRLEGTDGTDRSGAGDGHVSPGDGSGAPPGAPGASPGGESDGTRDDEPAYGEVLLAVEQGFVSHRVERSLNVPVWPGEMERLSAASDSAEESSRYEAALAVAHRALAGDQGGRGSSGDGASEPRPAPAVDPGECGVRVIPGIGRVLSPCPGAGEELDRRRARRDLEGTPRLLRVAWPEYRTVSRPAPVRVRAEGASGPRERWSADLSAAVVEEFGERAPEVLAKALLRAVVKNVVADQVEDEVEEEDETLGEVTGAALNVLGVLTERADTRSWNLLPGRIQLIRLRLPAGEHRLEVFSGPDGREEERPVETVDVHVPAAGMAVTSVRLWR